MNTGGKFIFAAAMIVFACAKMAPAHPLGNFTVNQYSRLDIGNSQVKIHAVLDMAEIPTFQAASTVDANNDGALSEDELDVYAEKITPGYSNNLFLTVNDYLIQFRPLSKKISLLPGSGNLSTLRVEWDLSGDLPEFASRNSVHFENKNNRERIGWNEIVVSGDDEIKIFDSTAAGSGATDELKAYPQEGLSAPLSERTADFSFVLGSLPPNAKALRNRDGQQTAPLRKDQFAELINVPEITPAVLLFGLLLAFGLGAIHALSPGHGKTVVGAYLVGSRGTIRHAVFLGATVTITHTLGVFALGLITLLASEYVLPERLMPFLNFISGLLVLFIGASLFKDRLFSALGRNENIHRHAHEHAQGNENFHSHDSSAHSYQDDYSQADQAHPDEHGNLAHTHDGVHYHSHLPPKDITWRSLLALGISGGLLPCPSALVLMLSAISLGRVGYGLILTLVFSFGLAATLTGIGLAFLYIGKLFSSPALNNNRIVKTLPVLSALFITCVGAGICYSSLK